LPRAHVMIRPFQNNAPSNANNVEDILSKMVLSKKFLDETGVIFEYYMRVFGWPDFVVSLYGPNEGLLKYAILRIRDECKGVVTSTIIGSCPEDQYLRVAEFRNKQLINLLNNFEKNNNGEEANGIIARAFSLEEAKNYIKWQTTLLDLFEKMVNNSAEAKSYINGLEAEKNLFKTLLSKVFLDKKTELSTEEKEKFLKDNS